MVDVDMHQLTCNVFSKRILTPAPPPGPPILTLGGKQHSARTGPTDNDMHHLTAFADRAWNLERNIKIQGRGGILIKHVRLPPPTRHGVVHIIVRHPSQQAAFS